MSKFIQVPGGMYRIEAAAAVNCETWLGDTGIAWQFSGGTWALVTSSDEKYPSLYINSGSAYTLQDTLVNGRPWWSSGSNYVYYSTTRQKYVCNVSNSAYVGGTVLGYEPVETADTVNVGSYIGDGWNEFDLPASLLNSGTIPSAITATHKGTVSSNATITFAWDIYLSSSRFGEYENADGDTEIFGTPIRDEEEEITGYVDLDDLPKVKTLFAAGGVIG